MRVKALIKSRYPSLASAGRRIRYSVWKLGQYLTLFGRRPAEVFGRIYRENKWGDHSSRSGPGSTVSQTATIRAVLPELLEELNCKTFLDIPCGDFFWMKMIRMDVRYIGADIVAELIENNQRQYGDVNRSFVCLDIIRDRLPKVDLIFCRDGLVHLSNSHVFRALGNVVRSCSTYFLTTTFVDVDRNEDIPTGSWRRINLQLAPFSFPAPLKLFPEQSLRADSSDKSLGLWRVADIPDHLAE